MTTASATSACQHISKIGRKNCKIITTDLLEETPQILYDGIAFAAIFQDPYLQGREAVRNLYDCIVSKKTEEIYTVTPGILLSSNVSAYTI